MSANAPSTNHHADSSAGDVNYAPLASSYSSYRRSDPTIAALIIRHLGDAKTILNVGAGQGSYEPHGPPYTVTAVEPSAAMRAGRPPHLSRAVDATAQSLPFPDASFDAVMTTISIHQWGDGFEAGIAKMRRVSRGSVVVLTADASHFSKFWFVEYGPQLLMSEAARFQEPELVRTLLSGGGRQAEVLPVVIGRECTDGFMEAYYARPEMFLDPEARKAQSSWRFLPDGEEEEIVGKLRADLLSGEWDRKYGEHRNLEEWESSLILVVSTVV